MSIFTKIKDFFVKNKEMRDFEKSKLEIKKLEDEWRKDWEKIGRVFNFDPIKEEKKALQSISKLIEKDFKEPKRLLRKKNTFDKKSTN